MNEIRVIENGRPFKVLACGVITMAECNSYTKQGRLKGLNPRDKQIIFDVFEDGRTNSYVYHYRSKQKNKTD